MTHCNLCGEVVGDVERAPVRPLIAHRECLLRSSMGGIGHLIDHEHFCMYIGDPDAKLPYRLSALLVDAFVSYYGVDESVRRSMESLPRQEIAGDTVPEVRTRPSE